MIRRLTNKPRGLLRDITIVLGLVFFNPNAGFMTIGAGVFLLGVALHFWSKGCLVRNWRVTTCGPYRLVRHPFYLASFLIDEGICVISGNVWLVAIYVPAFLLVYLPTIRREEKYLIGAHGDAYTSYASRVPALVPCRLHTILGPLGFVWNNIRREREMSRLLRLFAIPLYFVLVAAILHETPRDHTERTAVLCVSLALVLLLNGGSALLRRSERAMRRVELPETRRKRSAAG